MSAEAHDPELERLAQDLASLRPAGEALDRDRLFYAAGQAAARGRSWVWPGVAAGVVCLALGSCAALFLQPAPQGIERVVYVPAVAPSPSDSLADRQSAAPEAVAAAAELPAGRTEPLSFLGLERLVSRWGIDALPVPDSGPGAASRGTGPLKNDRGEGISTVRSLRVQNP
jgi:hypothetical protein